MKAFVVAAIAGTCLSTHGIAQTSSWVNPVNGNWNTVANWSPANVPDTVAESADISVAGSYTVTLDLSPTINSLVLGNPMAQLTVPSGRALTLFALSSSGPVNINANGTLAMNGTGVTNNGLIFINSNNSASTAQMRFETSGTIGGTGEIRLGRASLAQLNTAVAAMVTTGAGQLITGAGQINAALTNNGEIRANVASSSLDLFSNDKTNNNLITTMGTGQIAVGANATTIAIIQGSTARMVADNGLIRFNSGATSTINGGTLEAINGGRIERQSGSTTLGGVACSGQLDILSGGTVTMNGGSLTGPVNINANGTLAMNGTGVTNNGLIFINSNNSASMAQMRFETSGTIGGTGEIRLGRASLAQLTASSPFTLTLGGDCSLTGSGTINGTQVCNGRIAPGVGVSGVGQIDTRTSLTLSASSTADFEIGGPATSQFDRITGIGTLTLQNGTIRVSTVNGFNPTVGQTFNVVSGPSVVGEFCGHDLPRGWAVSYLPNAVRLTFSNCVADVDSGSGCGIPDGGVTIDDLLYYLAEFEAGILAADVDDGSSTGTLDGGVTIDDLLYYLFRFEAGC